MPDFLKNLNRAIWVTTEPFNQKQKFINPRRQSKAVDISWKVPKFNDSESRIHIIGHQKSISKSSLNQFC